MHAYMFILVFVWMKACHLDVVTAVWYFVWQTGETVLMVAIRLNKVVFMEKLINAGAKIDYRNKVCGGTVVRTRVFKYAYAHTRQFRYVYLTRTLR